MSLDIRLFRPEDTLNWDIFCENALQGTFLHTRKFLSYHQNRFIDCSLIITDQDKWLGIFPAALNPENPHQVISHPGITYGGFLHNGGLKGETMINTLYLVNDFYSKLGYKSLIYKVTPSFYHRSPAQDDLYGLFRVNANKIRCDLSSTIDLRSRLQLTKGRRWGINKAKKSGITIVNDPQFTKDFWEILSENLSEKYGVKPVHTLTEIKFLIERFPKEIRCICSIYNGSVVAGTILFVTDQVIHTQYIASNSVGRELSALDAVIEYCILKGYDEGKKWFDFGINNQNNGWTLNNNLYSYKNSFGGGGYVQEFYELRF